MDLRNDRTDSGSCKLVLGSEYLNGPLEPFLFGVLTLIPSEEQAASPLTRNYEFAVREFARRGGVPIDGKPRYPVAVACDVIDLDRSLDHLTSLGITSVIAPTATDVVLKQSFQRLNGERPAMFFINPLGSSSLLHSAANRGLLWSLLGDGLQIASAYPPLITRVDAYLRATRGLERSPRVMLVHDDEAEMTDIANFVHERLSGSAANYRRFALKSRNADSYRSYLDAQEGAAQLRPEVVIGLAGDLFIELLMRPLEANWSSFQPDGSRPFYLLSPHHAAEPTLLKLIENRPDLAGRLAGINAASAADPELYEKYFSALTAEYPNDTALAGTENFYDAVYFLLYAAAAASEPAPLALGEAMKRLISGPRYAVGGGSIDAVLEELEKPGSSISLYGTLGAPDFDAETGARNAPGSVWCVASTDAGLEYHYDVLRESEDGTLTGNFDCFPFP